MLTIGLALLVVVIAGVLINGKINKVSDQEIAAPGKDWSSPKKVEDYFVESLRFTQEDLERQKQREAVSFRPGNGSTLEAIVSNLHYYGFVRSEKALMYALERTEDKTPGNPGFLSVGENGSVDINASYRISENMTAWELADTLLNKSQYFGDNDPYHYMFMP